MCSNVFALFCTTLGTYLVRIFCEKISFEFVNFMHENIGHYQHVNIVNRSRDTSGVEYFIKFYKDSSVL